MIECFFQIRRSLLTSCEAENSILLFGILLGVCKEIFFKHKEASKHVATSYSLNWHGQQTDLT